MLVVVALAFAAAWYLFATDVRRMEETSAAVTPSGSRNVGACGIELGDDTTTSPGQWVNLAQMGEARQEVAVAELGGRIYAIGGFRADQSTADTVEMYDPLADRWELATPLPVPLHHAAAAAIGDTLYVIGGHKPDGPAVDAVYAHDPSTRRWASRAPMPTARGALAVGVVNGKIYAAGGSPDARERDFAAYDPATDTWTVLPLMPTPRNHHAAVGIDGTFYAVGGRSGSIGGITSVLEAFDVATNSWQARAPMPTARGGIAGAAAHGCLFVFGGEGNPRDPAGMFEQTEVYDPSPDTWQSLASMIEPRHGIGAATLGDRVYVPGGATVQGFGASGGHQALDLGGP